MKPMHLPGSKPALTLFPHQVKSYDWCDVRRRIALFMEMRLGKTRVTIAWANRVGAKRILVVAPLSVLGSWRDELKMVGEPTPYTARPPHTPATHAQLIKYKWVLINYESLRTSPGILAFDWDAVVLDESTRIKNPKAQITKVFNGGTITRAIPRRRRARKPKSAINPRVKLKVPKKTERVRLEGCHTKYRALLSGLPAPEGPMDYFEQLRFLYGGMCSCRNFWAFRERYFIADAKGWYFTPRPGTREAIKTELHSKAFVMSRKEAGIGERKVYETRTVELNPALRRIYNKAEREFVVEYGTKVKETNWPMVLNLWLGRMAGGFVDTDLVSPHKLDELCELVSGELKEEQIVVWCRFNAEIDHIKKRLDALNITNRIIIGKTKDTERDAIRKAFMDGKVRIIVCQIKCAKYGIDLSAADTAIYFSNSYSLEERAQSEDRIVHPAKRVPLLYVDLVAEETVDADVIGALREKHTESKFFLQALVKNFAARIAAATRR